MTPKPRWSVAPIYSRLNVLPRCVDNVLTRDEPDFGLIIVEDSTDEALSWLATLTDPRIEIIRPQRRRGDFANLAADWQAFRNAGLLQDGLACIWRDHREVRKYRRPNSNREAFMRISGTPADWT